MPYRYVKEGEPEEAEKGKIKASNVNKVVGLLFITSPFLKIKFKRHSISPVPRRQPRSYNPNSSPALPSAAKREPRG